MTRLRDRAMQDRKGPLLSRQRAGRSLCLRAGTLVLLFFHLLGGALHGGCGIAIHGSVPGEECSMTDAAADANEALPGHHCHGCFVVCPATPPMVWSAVDLTDALPRWSKDSFDRLGRRPSTPPPKASS